MEKHWDDFSTFYSYKELAAHQSFSYDFIRNHMNDLDLDCFGGIHLKMEKYLMVLLLNNTKYSL